MDTLTKVLNLVRQGDWLFTIDLKDAYFHVKIFKSHRKYLRFHFQGVTYQFRALCFGPTSAPRVFTKVISVVVAHLRKFNIRLVSYLDIWLAANETKRLLLQDRAQILSLLYRLGFVVNKKKSQLIPVQSLIYLGSQWDLIKGLVYPTNERLTNLKLAVTNIQKGHCTAKHFLILLGMIASCLELIPNARLFMRPIQLGRHFESRTCSPNIVVLEQDSGVEVVQSLGSTTNRPFCNIPKQTDSTVLLMDSTSSGICSRCTVHSLGKSLCICFSANSTCAQGPKPHAKVSVHSLTDSTTMAQTTPLSPVAETADSQPNTTAMQSGITNPMQGKSHTSKSTNSSSDCMAVIDKRLSSEGLSKETRKLLSKSWRKGTRKDYQSKFRQFDCWCREREIDPHLATLANCADFITHLFEKGLKYRTINGYRSMLSAVLAPVDKTPIGQHPFIIRLLRGVFNERPPVKKLVPEWNLLLVLESLKEAPFEPLKDASLRHLTWKVCFLLAITTFRRCSDLQSLTLGEDHVNIQRQGVTFIRTGLSKQDRPSHSDRKIFVPALPNNKTLDPKRALLHYLRRTEQFRKTDSDQEIVKMFLATRKPHKPVSVQTISRWLVSVIKFSYKKHRKTVGTVKGHSTRSVGPSWALFKGASLQQIMESADWSRETTFTKHYMKTVNTDYMNV